VKEWEHWRNILKILETTHDSRGDGVIDFWHRLPDEDGLGAWVFSLPRRPFRSFSNQAYRDINDQFY
jgi:hypothetical protein